MCYLVQRLAKIALATAAPGEPFPVAWTGTRAVVMLPEHIDATNSGQLRDQLLGLVNRGARVLMADMCRCTSSCAEPGTRERAEFAAWRLVTRCNR